LIWGCGLRGRRCGGGRFARGRPDYDTHSATQSVVTATGAKASKEPPPRTSFDADVVNQSALVVLGDLGEMIAFKVQ
jgi:hypothetical protein